MSRIRWIPTLALCLLASACDAAPVTPATPASAAASAAAPGISAQALLLRLDQLSGYLQQKGSAVSATSLGTQDQDPTITTRVSAQGLQTGARVDFIEDQRKPLTPFSTITTQALIFQDAQGAAGYASDEQARRRITPNQGTLAELPAPQQAVDTVVALRAHTPPGVTANVAEDAYFVVIRKGRVVSTLFAVGDTDRATPAEFLALVAGQEKDLQLPVG